MPLSYREATTSIPFSTIILFNYLKQGKGKEDFKRRGKKGGLLLGIWVS